MGKTLAAPLLSPLEKDILDVLWKKEQSRVRDIYNVLKKRKKVAHTSVAVLLDRLYEKGFVKREVETCKGGFRYIYAPCAQKGDYNTLIVQKTVDVLIEKFGNAAVTYFNERFGKNKGE